MNTLIEVLSYQPDDMTIAVVATLTACVTGLYTILLLISGDDA